MSLFKRHFMVAGTRQILFTDNKGWGQVYIHYWGSASGDTEWPGTAMTPAGNNDYNEPQYSFNIPTDVDGIVFSNGNGEQSADAYYESDIAGWYPLDTKDDQGHYNLGNKREMTAAARTATIS